MKKRWRITKDVKERQGKRQIDVKTEENEYKYSHCLSDGNSYDILNTFEKEKSKNYIIFVVAIVVHVRFSSNLCCGCVANFPSGYRCE
ncbi:Hypothetical predicted protein [Octopus vulgaris]|uniref:Uncharacterized protein n=1 Tax=Octopus vulgaris TaxID=6645 RepID=A0AA36AW71_OCTVU|nr:Hypothetical predicted protein [Octopus vulgaris]